MFAVEFDVIAKFGFPVIVPLYLLYKIKERKITMKKLHAWLMKLSFGIDLKCDLCHPPTYWKTERGKNIHRASHRRLIKYTITAYNQDGKKIVYNLKGSRVDLEKEITSQYPSLVKMVGKKKFKKAVQKYTHNPLEGQDVELFMRKGK
jgi:hypothetical protein